MDKATFVIDCEYNGMGGQLLSMALVGIEGLQDDTNEEFYAERSLPLNEPIAGWVKDNVLPYMVQDEPLSEKRFAKTLETFLSKYGAVHIVADWPEDIAHFCNVLITGPGERIDTPPLTMEVRRDLDAPSEMPHNALMDARGIANLYLHIEDLPT